MSAVLEVGRGGESLTTQLLPGHLDSVQHHLYKLLPLLLCHDSLFRGRESEEELIPPPPLRQTIAVGSLGHC